MTDATKGIPGYEPIDFLSDKITIRSGGHAEEYNAMLDSLGSKDAVLPRPGGLSKLKQDPNNARKHTPRNVNTIQESIQKNGFGRSLLVARDGTILAGNATYDALAAAGMEDVIEIETDGTKAIVVRRTDLDPTDPQAVALAIADNRAAELAEWDTARLQQIVIDFPDAIDGNFRPEELDSLLGAVAASEATREPSQVPLPDTPVTKYGSVWKLGGHILICGDATSPESWDLVDKYHEGEFRLLATDPPYNFDIVGGVRDTRDPNHNSGGRETKRILNDKMTDEDYADLLRDSFLMADARLMKGGGVYSFGPSGGRQSLTFQQVFWELWPIRQTIIWAKQHFVFGHSDYHWKHETIYYGWKGGANRYPVSDRSQTSVWEISRPTQTADMDHPSQKPVELIARIVANGAAPGESVLDPFAGTGSTLVACEQLGRTNVSIELSPSHCDLIVEKWKEASVDGIPDLLEEGTDIPEEDHA